DISKIEAGKIELRPGPVFLDGFIDNIAAIVRPHAEEKGLWFEVRKAKGAPAEIEVDKIRLRQVLLNLLGNAVNYTDKGSVILRIDTVGALEQGRRGVRFAVEDTGVGIERDQLETIFLPFEQAEKNRRGEEGTGLGLAISRQLIRLMGGDLHVESAPGKGSSFRFDLSLPVISAVGRTAVETTTNISGYAGGRRTILLVDDNRENRMVLANMLAPLGFDVVQAENGVEAIGLARKVTPDLVLMDLVMPDMDGVETTKRLRRLFGFQKTPIIAISASAFTEDRERCLREGCNRFLPKPIRMKKLLAVMEETLSLDWEYEDAPAVRTDSSPYAAPPADAIAELKALARYGNMRKIIEWADMLAARKPAHAAFAAHLKDLAKGYREQEIERLISSLSQ
ncbi:MAG: response regulator, partial [Desulfobacterales bacterium]|nr:response regulator [Desulfobacterales bacterium]